MNSEAEVQVLVELLTDLNKSIIVFESLSKNANARKNFRFQDFDELFSLIASQCEKVTNTFRLLSKDSLRISKLKLDYKKLLEKYQNLEAGLLKTKKESLVYYSSFQSPTPTSNSKADASMHTIKAELFSSSKMVPYRDSHDESENSKKSDMMLYEPMVQEMQRNANLVAETEIDIKKLEGKMEEINDILNTDILLTMVQEEPTPTLKGNDKNAYLMQESPKKVWWMRIFKKRKFCLIFFIVLFVIIVLISIIIPVSIK